ncbi:MAG: polyphosphate polymerase domain-containing protein [Clostridia bacterium]|nr:polyphosphate polymerase domain-containing protein [Clostridia bacterium]
MAVYVFKRVEKKYIVTGEQKAILTEQFSPFIEPDEHSLYTLCNIYYDTESFDLIRMSIEKPDFKEKLRIRSYGIPGENSSVYVELKRKYDKTVYKRRLEAEYGKARRYLSGEISIEDTHIAREIDYFCKTYRVSPGVLIAYEREAYKGVADENMRITFDGDIRYCFDTSVGFEDRAAFKTILPSDRFVMEIKANGAIPVEMARILNSLEIYPTSFSKYGRAYINEHKILNKKG